MLAGVAMRLHRIVAPWLHQWWGQYWVRNPHRTDYLDALLKIVRPS
jgi:hypothetical protein